MLVLFTHWAFTSNLDCYTSGVDLAHIRRLIIVAMFSDDSLMAQLVLKGGNALNLVYGYGSRGSLDVDFSIEEDFVDIAGTSKKIFTALRSRLSAAGYAIFDEGLTQRPTAVEGQANPRWGGYEIEFKMLEMPKFERISADLERARREALIAGPLEKRIFRIQISRFEYCTGKQEEFLDDYTIFVYSPAMIVAEKIRALCQQLPEYPLRRNPAPRARDFYDIHAVILETGLELGNQAFIELVGNMFAAKE